MFRIKWIFGDLFIIEQVSPRFEEFNSKTAVWQLKLNDLQNENKQFKQKLNSIEHQQKSESLRLIGIPQSKDEYISDAVQNFHDEELKIKNLHSDQGFIINNKGQIMLSPIYF